MDEWIIYKCVIGSRAYGLDTPESDTDYRGIYLPPADRHWSFAGVPEQIESDERQECFWEIEKFLSLALKANPNVLECLYTPMVEKMTPLAEELLAMRSAFLSRLAYQTYNSYVLSQFKKLDANAPKWKHVMHLIRLLLTGITVLEKGIVPVRVEAYREQLLAIRKGEIAWVDINRWREELHTRLDKAFVETTLPARPDYDRVEAFLLKARRTMVNVS